MDHFKIIYTCMLERYYKCVYGLLIEVKLILTEIRPFELSLFFFFFFLDFLHYRILSLCNQLLLQISLLIVCD